jgi:plastocyanin
MADTHVIAIVFDNGNYSVVPSDLLAKRGDQVTFKAINTDVSLTYDRPEVFRQTQLNLTAGAQATFTIQLIEDGVYGYTLSTPVEGVSPTRARIIIYS